jgi:hypothetical protein
MELKIYIAGKVTGEDTVACKRKFAAMEEKLKLMGCSTVINPMNLGIPVSWSWDEAGALCLKVLEEKANAIIMLNDWLDSKGAKDEYKHAADHDYQIFFEDDVEGIALLLPEAKWIDTSAMEFP